MKKGHILIVDDEPVILRFASAILSRQGLEVTTADNGDAALKLCLSQDFDLVLTDVIMPNMDGLELVRQLRQHGRDVPTLFMSGFTKEDHFPPSLLLEKPFNSEQLISAIDTRLTCVEREH